MKLGLKKSMLTWLVGTLVVLTPATLWASGSGHHSHGGEAHAKKAPKVETISVSGEVLDLSCYLGHGAKGKKHKSCAKSCLIKKHVSAGLLTDDGQVLLLVKDHKYEKAFKGVGTPAAQWVTVTGRRVKKGGLEAIMVHKIKRGKKRHH